MKNKLVGNECSSNDAEEQFNKLKRKKKKWLVEITEAEQIKERQLKRNEGSSRDLCDKIKHMVFSL